MKNFTTKLTYFVHYPLSTHKGNRKNKNKHFNSNAQEEKKFIRKKGNLFDLYTSLNE